MCRRRFASNRVGHRADKYREVGLSEVLLAIAAGSRQVDSYTPRETLQPMARSRFEETGQISARRIRVCNLLPKLLTLTCALRTVVGCKG